MLRKTSTRLHGPIKRAEKMLPTIENSVIKLQIWQQALEILDETEIAIEEESLDAIRAVTRFNKDYHFMCYHFYKTLDDLEKIGCIVRDLDEGLVDIRTTIVKKEVHLSWKLGEKKIEYWHDPIGNPDVRNRIISLPELDKKIKLKKNSNNTK